MAIFARVTENECINERHLVKGDNLSVAGRQLENGTRCDDETFLGVS